MSAPERIWAAPVTENYGEWQTTTDGLPRPTEYIRYSDYAALEAQLAERVKARSEPVQVYIDHADHTITTTLKDAIEDMKGFLAQGWDLQTEAHFMLALSALEATPPAPKVTECATEGCAQTATVRFERGGVGSDYCHGCYMRIQTLTAAQEAGKP